MKSDYEIPFAEIMFDVTWTAMFLSNEGKIYCEDSRNLFFECYEIARDFDKEFLKGEKDYLTEVEVYATKRLIQAFGYDKEDEYHG